jgi:beta-mannosidase
MDLAGEWTLSDGDHTVPFALPGDAITALHKAGVIPDPYFGRNEYDCRWVAERDWTISRKFTLTTVEVLLTLSGIDGVADVSVNGHNVLPFPPIANAFRSYSVLLKGVGRVGENEIALKFRSTPKEAARLAALQPFPVPYAAQNCPIPHGNMLRKPACDWGWDWNIALCPFGVTGGVTITPWPMPAIGRVCVEQWHTTDHVRLDVSVRTESADGAPYEISFLGQTRHGSIDRHNSIAVRFALDHPDLWWPSGLGPQTLNDLVIRIGDQVQVRRIGLRQMQLVTEKDDVGLGFKFRVNGHDVFARGANWIPADALSGRITQEATRALLQSAVDANMNMIRVWGGGRYEPDWFYDLCDEMGLMVWQDFMFACNLYPSTDAFLHEVRQEVRENVIRMHHHACIALWCGDNELVGALTWFEESRRDRDRYLVNYDRLNRAIETELKELVPDANWWPSSPSPGPLSFGDAWHDDTSGDMHFWSVWHEGRDFDQYRDVAPRFCSEFGFQSYPSLQVIEKFAGPADRNIASPVMESHQKNAGGNARIAETMFRYFRFPVDFPNFVYLSQVQQGLAIKTAVTQWRSLKPHCMGALIWQLNDTWPVCSWSSLDHGGNWKLLHHMAQHFFAPVIVSAVPIDRGIELRAVNDTRDVVDLTVAAMATAMDGTTREIARNLVAMGPDAAIRVLHMPTDALGMGEMLAFTWTDGGTHRGGDVFAPQPYKSYDLRAPDVTQTVSATDTGWHITLSAQNLALFVALEADQPGRFSLNAFTLFPGHDATVTFTPVTPGATPRFTLRDLHSATYGT